MLQRIREGLTVALIALLPLHAFLVTVGTRVIAGPGHAPLAALAIWKEALLGIILILAFIEWIQQPRQRGHWSLVTGHWDVIDALIGGLFMLSLIVTAVTHADWALYAIGFKYDLLPLLVFLALRRVPWSEMFFMRVLWTVFFVFLAIALWGIASAVLPMSVFTFLGYSDLHSLYQPGAPLPPFHQIEAIGIRRIQSTFAGPNQLGMWLLLPLGLLLPRLLAAKRFDGLARKHIVLLGLLGIALLFTFSRAAWIAAFLMAAVAAYRLLPRRLFARLTAGTVTLSIVAAPLILSVMPSVFLRTTSTSGHIERPIQAYFMIAEHPLGRGLGSAGPASNRVSDACVYLEKGADVAWAVGRDDLCVFVGYIQMQPVDRGCKCAFLPENWYLQIGVELGWMGMLLFGTLILMILKRLYDQWSVVSGQWSAAGGIFLAILGVSIAALVLHAWEDSAVAYSLWLLAAAVLPVSLARRSAD